MRGGGCTQSKASGPEDVTLELGEEQAVVEKTEVGKEERVDEMAAADDEVVASKMVVEKPVEKAAEVAVDKVACQAAEGVEEMTRQKMGEQVVVPPGARPH